MLLNATWSLLYSVPVRTDTLTREPFPRLVDRCGHCKNMAEAYKDAAKQLKAKGLKVLFFHLATLNLLCATSMSAC